MKFSLPAPANAALNMILHFKESPLRLMLSHKAGSSEIKANKRSTACQYSSSGCPETGLGI